MWDFSHSITLTLTNYSKIYEKDVQHTANAFDVEKKKKIENEIVDSKHHKQNPFP